MNQPIGYWTYWPNSPRPVFIGSLSSAKDFHRILETQDPFSKALRQAEEDNFILFTQANERIKLRLAPSLSSLAAGNFNPEVLLLMKYFIGTD